MQTLFAGIDLGTSGCRLILIDQHQTVQFQYSIDYEETQQQSAELWWQAVCDCFAACPNAYKNVIQSLAIDGTSGTLLLVDEKGKPSSSVLMYNDLRAVEQAARIKRFLPSHNGGQGASGSLARLFWLLKNEATEAHQHALHQADYILGKLTNSYAISDENNCLKLGYDVINQCWPLALLDELGIYQSLLPKVYPAGTAVANIDVLIAEQLGLPQSLQLVTGTTDSIAAFIATGANQVGEAVTSLGSTLVVKQISEDAIFEPDMGVYSHRLSLAGESHWLVGGASNSGGKVLRHFFSQAQLNDMTPHLTPEKSTDLQYYPLVETGERFPVADVNKKPLLEPRPESDTQFFQGMLEGIATIEKQAYDSLASLGAGRLVSIRSVGGGSNNDAWTEIRKNTLKVDMISPEQTEAAYGSALLALDALKPLQ